MNMKLGTELTQREQAHVLNAFVYRYTGNHRPVWAHKECNYPVQFKDDQDWLANTRFAVTKSGALDRRASECESSPTWPNNPELRKN
jgi:hypothetical protein